MIGIKLPLILSGGDPNVVLKGTNEVGIIVKAAIAETGASGMKEMGKVMAAVMPKTKGRADGKLVNTLVKKLLS